MGYQSYFKNEIANYPEMINTKQMMEVCGYKTMKTIYKILSKGKIEYIMLGRQYLIVRDSVFQFLYESRYLNEGLDEYTKNLKFYYENLFKTEPELLTFKDIRRITGYAKASIQRWIGNNELEAFKIKYAFIIPKECLIVFMISKRFRSITRKNSVHKAQIQNFRKEVLNND